MLYQLERLLLDSPPIFWHFLFVYYLERRKKIICIIRVMNITTTQTYYTPHVKLFGVGVGQGRLLFCNLGGCQRNYFITVQMVGVNFCVIYLFHCIMWCIEIQILYWDVRTSPEKVTDTPILYIVSFTQLINNSAIYWCTSSHLIYWSPTFLSSIGAPDLLPSYMVHQLSCHPLAPLFSPISRPSHHLSQTPFISYHYNNFRTIETVFVEM